MKTKGDLRRHFREQLAKMAHLEAELSIKVGRFVSGFLRTVDTTETIGCFQALAGEPNLQTAILELEDEGFELAFPAIAGEALQFYRVDDYNYWTDGPYGIKEPNPKLTHFVPTASLQSVLIPGLAFDKKGNRLGRGKGFYDRALQNFKGTKIGVAFSQQLLTEELPAEPHDVRMDVIITELGVHFARERVM